LAKGRKKDTDVDYVKRQKRIEKRRVRKMRRYAWCLRLKHIFLILLYNRVYKLKYKHEKPDYWALVKELNTPYKVAGYVSAWANVVPDRELDSARGLVTGAKVSDKTVVLFINNILRYHGYRSYTFWIGYRANKIMPVSAVILRKATITLSAYSYKVHIGDQFDIMRDYYPEANRWIILDPEMGRYIMSYSKGRIPEIAVYDDGYWGERMPFAQEVVNKLKLKPLSQRGEVV
jgi:hypothetical protein